MDIIYTKKTLEEIIGCWIETNYIARKADHLVEYTDEVGELYDAMAWFRDNQSGNGNSIMDVHVMFEQASEKADLVARDAEDKLKAVLKIAYETGDKLFAGHKYDDIDKALETLFDYFIEVFDDIYDYNQDVQVENFYKVFGKALKELQE